MKKYIILSLVALGAALTSCNDFLDDNRYPLDKQTNSPLYWTSKVNVQAQINTLYGNFMGYSQGQTWQNDFYFKSLNDDQCSHMESGSGMVFAQWTYQFVPAANSVWDASYIEIRRCNYIINNSNLDNKVENDNFIAQARLIRAQQYYELVRALGDVPLVTTVLNPDSPEVYGERTNRNEVMDFVLEDLNFATENIIDQGNKVFMSKDLANAMKSEICLYEASYARYHQKDDARAKKYYAEVVNACNAIMDQGYSICSDYRSLYNSYFKDDKDTGIPGLYTNPEVIFMKAYQTGGLTHSAASFLSSETPIPGMTKDAFDAYLFRDAKPLATTSLSKSDLPVINADGNFDISAALEVRDARLGETIDPYLAFGTLVTFSRENSAKIQSTTGYTIKKYVNPKTPYNQTVNANTNLTCAPIYWLAWTYCDYLEARAELDALTDADINKCMKPLWDRAKIDTSKLNKAYLESMGDPANNMNVSSLIWEIRRLRRCELMFDRNHRYWDLIRWHQLQILDSTDPKNINTILGANVSLATADQLKDVFTTGGYINGSETPNGTSFRKFSDREYLQPLGSTIINLYNAKELELPQNPGWE